jgi:hypothetical protein
MIRSVHQIVESTLKAILTEAPPQETDNAPSTSANSLFTPAEEKFLGKFDAYGTQQIGIIYSLSDIGVREFIGRSGKDLNITPNILLSLLRKNAIRIVPYTGWGRNNDYTIELQLSLDDVKGLGAEDKEKVEKGEASAGGGAGVAPTEPPAGAPEVAWVVRYGDILVEAAKITKAILKDPVQKTKNIKSSAEKNKKADKDTEKKSKNIGVSDIKYKMIDKLPKQFVNYLDRIIKMIQTDILTNDDKERIIGDILNMLQNKLKLTPRQIQQSYEFYKSQKRLQKYMEKL